MVDYEKNIETLVRLLPSTEVCDWTYYTALESLLHLYETDAVQVRMTCAPEKPAYAVTVRLQGEEETGEGQGTTFEIAVLGAIGDLRQLMDCIVEEVRIKSDMVDRYFWSAYE